MRAELLLSLLVTIATETCVPLLRNYRESIHLRKIPGRILLWNSQISDFVVLEALTRNDTLICSVDVVKDLRGRTVVAATDFMNPYLLQRADGEGVTGFIGDVWTTLEETLGFRTIYRTAATTASRTLMNGEAHALLVATAIYSYASGYYAYSTTVTTNSYALFVQSDGTRIPKSWYVRIFSPSLWATIIVSTVCVTLVLLVMYRVKKLVCENYADCDDELASAFFDVLFVVAGITGQGLQRMPNCWSLRILTLSHLTMGMLLYSGFSSTLTSYLAIRGNSVPLSDLGDVAKKRTHSLCLRNDSSAYLRFTKNGSLGGELREEWRDLVNGRGCPDMRDAMSLRQGVCVPGLAFLEAPDIFLPIYQQTNDVCRVVQLPEAYWGLNIAFLHARIAGHRRLIDIQLMRLRSAGILRHLERKWIFKDLDRSSSTWSTFQQVEYAHIRLTVIYLVAAMLLSAILCLLEIAVWRWSGPPREPEIVRSNPRSYLGP